MVQHIVVARQQVVVAAIKGELFVRHSCDSLLCISQADPCAGSLDAFRFWKSGDRLGLVTVEVHPLILGDPRIQEVHLPSVELEVENLQKKTGIPTRFDIDIDAERFNHLVTEVKQDPAGLQYPLPDEVITTCLKESVNVSA